MEKDLWYQPQVFPCIHIQVHAPHAHAQTQPVNTNTNHTCIYMKRKKKDRRREKKEVGRQKVRAQRQRFGGNDREKHWKTYNSKCEMNLVIRPAFTRAILSILQTKHCPLLCAPGGAPSSKLVDTEHRIPLIIPCTYGGGCVPKELLQCFFCSLVKTWALVSPHP